MFDQCRIPSIRATPLYIAVVTFFKCLGNESVKKSSAVLYWVSQKKYTPFLGCEIKHMIPMFKTEVLIYELKDNLDEKVLYGKITHHLNLGKCRFLMCLGTRIPHSILVHSLLAIEIKIPFLKLTP